MAHCASSGAAAPAMTQQYRCVRTLSQAAAALRPPPLLLLAAAAAAAPAPSAAVAAAARPRCGRRRPRAPPLTRPLRAQGDDSSGSSGSSSNSSGNAPPQPQSDADFDLAVFRFTLGIPGFEDRMVPRLVGLAAAALVALNHALSGGDPPPAQARAELVDALLAALCIVLPDIEEKLLEAAGSSRGRRAAATGAGGSAAAGAGGGAGAGAAAAATASGFWLAEAPALAGGEAARRELAWASFALLRNTNSLAVIVFGPGGRAVMARGTLAATAVSGGRGPAAAEAALSAATRDAALGGPGGEVAGLLAGGEEGGGPPSSSSSSSSSLWLPDRAAMARAGLGGWATVPGAAQSALVVRCRGGSASGGGAGGAPKAGSGGGGGGGKKRAVGELAPPAPVTIVALSDRVDGLTSKDRKWVEAIADKLAGAGCAAAAAAEGAAGAGAGAGTAKAAGAAAA